MENSGGSPSRLRLTKLVLIGLGLNVLEVAGSSWAFGTTDALSWLEFGAQSVIESLSGCVILWLNWKERSNTNHNHNHEYTAVKIIAVLFIVMAFIGPVAEQFGFGKLPPDNARTLGMTVWFTISMFWLAMVKWREAKKIGSTAGDADAHQSFMCALSSLAMLLAVSVNYFWGWPQFHRLAEYIVAALMVFEGIRTWRRRKLCCA